jgi:transcriptional regulator with XRE-family HTH domain
VATRTRTVYYDPDLVRERREAAGFEGAEGRARVASALGCSARHVLRWEQSATRGKEKVPRPNVEQLAALALLFDCSVSDFFRDSSSLATPSP